MGRPRLGHELVSQIGFELQGEDSFFRHAAGPLY
jgi:hypothetical protein